MLTHLIGYFFKFIKKLNDLTIINFLLLLENWLPNLHQHIITISKCKLLCFN